MISILDLLHENMAKPVAKMENFNYNKHKIISDHQPFAEDDSFDDASGFGDFVEGGLNDTQSTDGFDDTGFDTGFDDMGSYGFDDGGFGNNQQEESLPKSAIEFLENIDESDEKLIGDLLTAYGTLYEEGRETYNRFLIENLSATDYSDEVEEIKKQYKKTLKILRDYISRKYKNESTISRVRTFLDFKAIINNNNEMINVILEKTR